MVTLLQIRKMLVAHGLWKTRLQAAIESGNSDFTLAEVSVDDRCEFGRWLYRLPSEDKSNPLWKEVQAVHAEFHRQASKILELALAGERGKALAALDESNQISGKLVGLLTQWAWEPGPKRTEKASATASL